ncbi:MAG: hypothetical protein ACR2II_13695 [Chthoniobacterales bacterium]
MPKLIEMAAPRLSAKTSAEVPQFGLVAEEVQKVDTANTFAHPFPFLCNAGQKNMKE